MPIEQASLDSSRVRILAVARSEFATRGFAGARLQDVAEQVGLSHPTLLYHFGSKEGLYAAVIEAAVHDWAQTTHRAISTGLRGFEQVAALIEAGFEFFATHQEFVMIVRREAIEGGERLEGAMADHLRPFLESAVAFLEGEVRAGRLRPHDSVELMQLCYAALLTYFSDSTFRARLLDEEPLSPRALHRYRDALTAILRAALEPAGSPAPR
jgi:TetR/AcrR family transcriptional regulator